ncbi:MAG: hydrolase [Pedosphaera sp.]|nr:hydrolase [Pedosphaera sp.]
MVVRLVLFDIDGTLLRTGGAGGKAFECTFASEFKIPRATEGLSFAGRTDTSLVGECFRQHRIEATPDNFRRFFDAYVFWLDHWLGQLDGGVCPGVNEFISNLERLPTPPLLGLLTGNIRLGAEIKLRHFGLWEVFESGAFGDDHEDRNRLALIAQRRGRQRLGGRLPGEHILVIGDTPLDIACANAINAKVLAVGTGGFSCEQLGTHRPTWVAENLLKITPSELCA